MMSEKELRGEWSLQLLDTTRLLTTDGRRVVVVRPGVANPDAGPDFLDALIRVGATLYHGDVEIHLAASGWQAHRHHLDPHYNKVILHVVLLVDGNGVPPRTLSGRELPVLSLADCRLQVPSGAIEQSPPDSQVVQEFSLLPSAEQKGFLDKFGKQRIERKILRLRERLMEILEEERPVVRERAGRYGFRDNELPPPGTSYSIAELTSRRAWDQLLYEGILEALGYSKNCAPFAALARTLRIGILRPFGFDGTSTMMALLFGTAGLLPVARHLPEPATRRYVGALRRRWREVRPAVTRLHEGDWLFFRLRPANFPTARLAVATFLLPKLFGPSGTPPALRPLLNAAISVHDVLDAIRTVFSFEPDEFWKHHVSFTGKSGTQGARLGGARLVSIIANVIAPAAELYAGIISRKGISAATLLASLPSAHDATVMPRVMRSVGEGFRFESILQQQGFLELQLSAVSRQRRLVEHGLHITTKVTK